MDYSNTILISPFSKWMRNGKRNPKEYPYWIELINLLKSKGYAVIQIGVQGEPQLTEDFRIGLSLKELSSLMAQCHACISVDNFFHHFSALNKIPCIVLWGKSDPVIFGHLINHNLLKSRSYLRQNQFDIWETEEYDPNVFVKPEEVLNYIT